LKVKLSEGDGGKTNALRTQGASLTKRSPFTPIKDGSTVISSGGRERNGESDERENGFLGQTLARGGGRECNRFSWERGNIQLEGEFTIGDLHGGSGHRGFGGTVKMGRRGRDERVRLVKGKQQTIHTKEITRNVPLEKRKTIAEGRGENGGPFFSDWTGLRILPTDNLGGRGGSRGEKVGFANLKNICKDYHKG